MKHKLIVIEGIDNVGKTSSAKLLAKRLAESGLPATYYKTPPVQFSQTTKLVNESASRDAHFLYHAAMVKYAEKEIAKLLEGKSAVCDRWFYSTYAYHAAAGSRLQLHWDCLMEVKPDYAFLLLVRDEDERVKRALQKGVAAERHDLKTKNEAPMLVVAESILRSAGLEHIDTTSLSLEEVVDVMLRRIVHPT